MKKIILTLAILATSAMADIHLSKSGEILDPGTYWAVHARYAIDDFKKGKGSKSTLMRHLLNSASYGFNPSRFAIGMIYANGSNGFEIDLPRAYAWLNIASKKKNGTIILHRDEILKKLSQKEKLKANKILSKINRKYGNNATFKKFQKWIDTETTVTGSKVIGNHSYLNVHHRLANGENISTAELIKRLNKLYDKQLINQGYEVKPQEIKAVN